MGRFKVAISTQSPLLRFLNEGVTNGGSQPGGSETSLGELVEGRDYAFNAGGLCRTVLPSVRRWNAAGWLDSAEWFCLQTQGPALISFDDVPMRIHHLRLTPEELGPYARVKEKLWASIHGNASPPLDVEDFRFYSRYNWFTADSLLSEASDLDVAYVHDFQLLQLGALVGLAAPAVLRWHVPFVPEAIPSYTRRFLVRAMEDFDSVMVSTRRDLQGLLKAGYRGRAHQLYPTIESADWPNVPDSDVLEFESQCGLRPDDRVLLLVARMDPIKRQDLLFKALKRVLTEHPGAKAVLVGNGSFSSSKNGGMGLDKASAWRQELQALASQLKIEDHVVFAHWVPDRLLAASYCRADAVVLPSDIEGFGLTILEAWRYAKPPIVSTGTGVAELVEEGVNGFTFAPGDDETLARHISLLLGDENRAAEMGESGKAKLNEMDVRHAASRESQILEEAIDGFRRD